jgi:hypothetical protein
MGQGVAIKILVAILPSLLFEWQPIFSITTKVDLSYVFGKNMLHAPFF